MAANFWNSTHYRNWLRKVDDVYQSSVALLASDKTFSADEVSALKVVYSQVITVLSEKCKLRQRVAATAIVYLRRFYARQLVREYDPRLIAPVCLYLAAKAEEHTLHAKIIIAQMNVLYDGGAYPYGVAHIFEHEFKVINALDFDLIIFHPYRPLLQYCADFSLSDLLPAAWPILNDSYKTDACLKYPPYLIAIACIFIAATLRDRVSAVNEWLRKIGVDLQELAHVTQYLSQVYVNPARFAIPPTRVRELNEKLHAHCATVGAGPLKAQPGIPSSSIAKKPPSSSRPKIASKLTE